MKSTTRVWQRRFLRVFESYLDSIVDQAQNRVTNEAHDVSSYMDLRRGNSGVWPTLSILEIGIDAPPEIFDHPIVIELAEIAIDMVILDNVSPSYHVDHHVLTLIDVLA